MKNDAGKILRERRAPEAEALESDAEKEAKQCFASLRERINSDSALLAAVSGGSDSMAMMLLTREWAKENEIPFHAVTFDHGLRRESAEEAEFVAQACRRLGIKHETLEWKRTQARSARRASMEEARIARYDALARHARCIGARIIALGHTRDDQAETVAMRLLRVRGEQAAPGLSGMNALARFDRNIMLIRPLLNASRKSLREYLTGTGQEWIEDPSNQDEKNERIRIRKILVGHPRFAGRLTDFASVASRMRSCAARDAASLLSQSAKVEPGPVWVLDAGLASRWPRPVAAEALAALVAMAGGAERRKSAIRLGGAMNLLEGKGGAGKRLRLTIGGAVVERDGGLVRLWRERRNLPPPSVLPPGESLSWDGRVEIVNREREAVTIRVASAGEIAQAERERGSRFAVRPRDALGSTPMVARCGGGIQFPLAEGGAGLRSRSLERFCPQSDWPLAAWLEGEEIPKRWLRGAGFRKTRKPAGRRADAQIANADAEGVGEALRP